MNTEYLQANISRWLAFLLTSGEAGHKQPIKKIMDMDGNTPGPDNNFLLSEDGNKFAGQFANTSNQVFEFSIVKKGDTWLRTFKPSTKVKDNGVQ